MSCTSCAQTFENNVKNLKTVENADVNFGASKITVHGSASIEELEKAGAFENLQVSTQLSEKEAMNIHSILRDHWNVLTSFLLLLVGLVGFFTLGDEHPLTIGTFLAAIVIGGYDLLIAGAKNLVKLRFDMKTLMTIAVIGAIIIGEWVEASIVVILFAISEALEKFSMDQARSSIQSLIKLAPNEATVRRGGEEFVVNVDDLQKDDIVLVKPGEKLPIDGKIESGESSINQAAITGESMPIHKKVDDNVFAGTLNEEGFLEVRVTKLVKDTTLAKIIHMVEEAQNDKAPAQQFVDRFAKYYTPFIMLVALAVATLPPLFLSSGYELWIYQGLAVLVVGCPCALVISTPVAIVTAIGSAARNGVLIKGGAYLETLGKVKAIAFDKTGTITRGEPVVQQVEWVDSAVNQSDLLTAAYELEKRSQHPLAQSIMRYVDSEIERSQSLPVENFHSTTGKGIAGRIGNNHYKVGSPSMYENLSAEITTQIDQMRMSGQTVILLAKNDEVKALFGIADEIREHSPKVIEQLKRLGVKESILLTGDHNRTAQAISEKVGIKRYLADLLPDDKQDQIKKLQEEYGGVAMVGDGVNDAPALATSDVGIAMGGAGTDTALETADIALMGDDIEKLPFTVKLSRRALNIIKQNIAFALGIKIIALLLVVPGWLTLWIAILADVGATLLVTFNGMRLLKNERKAN
ncbi:heavy metal translocating P-type ATPase [Halalkalibacillus sediminis]|uniref:Cd(2+)-exporting ATPase n=2 Tax=Halalkalibacillus sediminis TaxID=2018042 RepID=A0A2I0QT97_9BACI|nr:heavy metal translocating P-type ATPase [Halalkalibacillus sediminis]